MNQLITNNQTSNFYNHLIELLSECKSFTFNVAFVNFSGVQLLLDTLKDCEERGIKGKVLTSTYLNFTQPKALEKLLEFKNIELKIFDCSDSIGFHSKTYFFEFEEEYKVLLGSSNITSSAFKTNIEWNIKTVSKKDDSFFKTIEFEFENLWEQSFYVDEKFLCEYKSFQENQKQESFKYQKKLKINSMQEKALEKLEFLRGNGEKKALAIAATGSGKTYLAAFDVKKNKPKKALFIVHRENILIKAKRTFESIIKDFSCGLFTGNKKELECDYIFATIQTLSASFEKFKKDEFDYIIVDEAHHITSSTYKKVCDYFESKFLLGLTATPNRMDKVSIYEVFNENIACDIRLNDALEENLVTPFHYYGISDIQIDYEGIDLADIRKLSKLLMINKRVDFIIEKMNFYGHSGKKRKILAFCISKEHAKFMSEEFNKRGIESISLDSGDSILSREKNIKNLEDENNKLEAISSVDIFNEGVDIPSINIVLMLRPTNSPIIFVQQLGRGLRKAKNKEFLTLIDFIGNHKKTYLIALALVGKKYIDKESIKLSLLNNFANFPNAHISMDEVSKQRVLNQIESENFNSMKYLKEQYFEFKTILGNRIPNLEDFINHDEFISPLPFIWESRSYLEFLVKVEKKDELKKFCEDENFLKALRFLQSLLPIKRVYEFVILKYLLDNKSCSKEKAFKILSKYLQRVDENTIEHTFAYLNQDYFDSAQKKKFLKLVEQKNENLFISKELIEILENENKKIVLEDTLNYAIVSYEKSFGTEDYGLPFLKLYEKYNMLNIAQLCNFNKIHSSFRGSGFLKFENDFFLFITLEKESFAKGSQYNNVFFDNQNFNFISKPSHSQEKGDGQKLCSNKNHNVKLHIFVRKFSHVDKKVQAFIYLGLANTIEYRGNKPIELQLRLEKPLLSKLFEEFTKVV